MPSFDKSELEGAFGGAAGGDAMGAPKAPMASAAGARLAKLLGLHPSKAEELTDLVHAIMDEREAGDDHDGDEGAGPDGYGMEPDEEG